MNRKEVFLKCQQCINDIQTAANSKTFIKYRKEQITLRYFFVRNRQMLSVIQTDADTAYEIYQCDWSSDVCSSDLEIASTFIRWHELSANFQFDIRWYD